MKMAKPGVGESILSTVKKAIGISADDTAFDPDILLAINTAFYTLYQLGVGDNDTEPFRVEDERDTWDDFLDDGEMEMYKSYVVMRTRMMFDPPTNSFLTDAINAQIKEFETRMTWGVDERKEYYVE